MSVPEKTTHMKIVPIVIKRGSLGMIRIGPSDIEIPSEDVVLTSSLDIVNFADLVTALVINEAAKLKQQTPGTEKSTETAPTQLLVWPKVEKKVAAT